MLIDISLILCLHREGKYLLRTLRSLKEAVHYARAEGLIIELIAVLDRADDLTRMVISEFDSQAFDRLEIIEVDNGSLGPSRNAGCARATGKYFMLCDGDDLISFNFISNIFYVAEREGPMAIVIPEWVMDFGEHYSVTQYANLDCVTPLAFLDIHPYISRICFHHDLFSRLKFKDVRLSKGYAYEDWLFNADAVAIGYRFEVAAEAILFYRIRKASLLRQADQISVMQISPSILFQPKVYIRVCSSFVKRLRHGQLRSADLTGKGYLSNPSCQYLIAAANRIEPQIEPKYIQDGHEWFRFNHANLDIGMCYYDICNKILDVEFNHIFLCPYFGVGGAERYFANIINGVHANVSDARILLILGEWHPANEWLNRLPESVTVVDLAHYISDIGEHGVDLITLKLIQNCPASSTIHIRQSTFGQRFYEKFGRAIYQDNIIFYYFCEELRMRNEFLISQPWSFSFISDNIESLSFVVADNIHIARVDRDRIGLMSQKWKFLPTRHDPPIDRYEAIEQSRRPLKRIMWASRLSWQKRPSLIRKIALKLFEFRQDLIIDVYGGHFVEFDPAELADLPNLVCCGPYDDFADAAQRGYFCFLYTSLFDGIPTVLLEAAGLGLPIIAPDVPAIDEFVVDGETGVLLESLVNEDDMAQSYVNAIIEIADNIELRAKLAAAAYDQVVRVHGTEPYTRALMDILESSHGQ